MSLPCWNWELAATSRNALVVSVVSVAFTLALGLSGVVLGLRVRISRFNFIFALVNDNEPRQDDSSATLGYGLQSFVDVFSSLIVIRRFWGAFSDNFEVTQSCQPSLGGCLRR